MNKVNSIFGQILQIFPHQDFGRAVRETRAKKGVKGFKGILPAVGQVPGSCAGKEAVSVHSSDLHF